MAKKETFFNNLHKELGFLYQFSPNSILRVRSLYIGNKWSKLEIIKWASENIKRKNSQEIINICALPEKKFDDIVRLTEFDKT